MLFVAVSSASQGTLKSDLALWRLLESLLVQVRRLAPHLAISVSLLPNVSPLLSKELAFPGRMLPWLPLTQLQLLLRVFEVLQV